MRALFWTILLLGVSWGPNAELLSGVENMIQVVVCIDPSFSQVVAKLWEYVATFRLWDQLHMDHFIVEALE